MAQPTSESSSPIAEISHGPTAFERFLDRNQKLMILLAVAIALGTGAWVVISGMEEGKRLAAGGALVAADDIPAMQDVIKNHRGTTAAVSASVLLSDMQWNEGQQSSAIDTLKAEIDEHPDHPATVPARARLGTRLLQQGDRAAAKSRFEDLVDRPEAAYLAPYALASLSEIARQDGDREKAKKLLERASTEYPDNLLRGIATRALNYIDFQKPEEIDPPAPEPVEDDGTTPPEPDFSTPVELDPTNPGTGTGNPLLDNLTGETTPESEAPEAPGPTPQAPPSAPETAPETAPQDAPADNGGETAGSDPASPATEPGE